MLDLLRKRAGSWVIKTTLLLITLSFVLFFGYNEFQGDLLNQRQFVARVGKNAVPRQKFDLLLDETLEKAKGSFKEGIPKNVQDYLQQNLLDQLVLQEVAFLYARSLGLDLSDEVLAQEIQKNPNLVKDGLFDFSGYHERFLPYYRRSYGEDFESALRKDLTRERLFQVGQVLFEPWEKILTKSLKEGDPPISSSLLLSYWMTQFRDETEIELY